MIPIRADFGCSSTPVNSSSKPGYSVTDVHLAMYTLTVSGYVYGTRHTSCQYSQSNGRRLAELCVL